MLTLPDAALRAPSLVYNVDGSLTALSMPELRPNALFRTPFAYEPLARTRITPMRAMRSRFQNAAKPAPKHQERRACNRRHVSSTALSSWTPVRNLPPSPPPSKPTMHLVWMGTPANCAACRRARPENSHCPHLAGQSSLAHCHPAQASCAATATPLSASAFLREQDAARPASA